MASIGFPHNGVPDTGWKIWLVGTIFPAVNLILLTLRLRWRSSHDSLGRDDALIFVSFLFSIALTVFMDLAIAHGYGEQKSDLSIEQSQKAIMFFYVDQIFYKLVVMFSKISILALYIRIFSQSSKFIRWGSISMITVVGLWSTASILMTTLQCLPVQATWDKSITDAKCLDSDALWYQYAVINPTTDILILLLPVRDVLRLHVPLKQKIGLLAMFSSGTVTCAISIARVVSVAQSTDSASDITGSFTTRSSLTIAEANAGIFCACLIALRAWFCGVLRHLRWSHVCASWPVGRAPRKDSKVDWVGALPEKTLSELSAESSTGSGSNVTVAASVAVPERAYRGRGAGEEGEKDDMMVDVERGGMEEHWTL